MLITGRAAKMLSENDKREIIKLVKEAERLEIGKMARSVVDSLGEGVRRPDPNSVDSNATYVAEKRLERGKLSIKMDSSSSYPRYLKVYYEAELVFKEMELEDMGPMVVGFKPDALSRASKGDWIKELHDLHENIGSELKRKAVRERKEKENAEMEAAKAEADDLRQAFGLPYRS